MFLWLLCACGGSLDLYSAQEISYVILLSEWYKRFYLLQRAGFANSYKKTDLVANKSGFGISFGFIPCPRVILVMFTV